MTLPDPDLRRTWLFGPGADARMHEAMLASGADALILDLEDFTPAPRRATARRLLHGFVERCRANGSLAAVRINALEADGTQDLAAAMAARPDVIAYPMSERATQIQSLDAAIDRWEAELGLRAGSIEILPVCETALGVVDVRAIAAASARVRCAAPRTSPPTCVPSAAPTRSSSTTRGAVSSSSAAPRASSRSTHLIPSTMSRARSARLTTPAAWVTVRSHWSGPSTRRRSTRR